MRGGSGGAGQTTGGFAAGKIGCRSAQPQLMYSTVNIRFKLCLCMSELPSQTELEELEAFVLGYGVQVGVADHHVELELAVAPAELELLFDPFGRAEQIIVLVAVEDREDRVEIGVE